MVAAFVCILARAPAAPRENGAQQLTAEELLLESRNAYASGKYAEAVAGFERFIADFGEAPEAQQALGAVRYQLAMSCLHLQDFPKALETINACLSAAPAPSQEQRAEMLFWQGVCRVQAGEYQAAVEHFEGFAREFPTSPKAAEALLLAGTALALAGEFSEAATRLNEIKRRLPPVDRGRAATLELYSHIEGNDHDAALKVVVEEFPRIGDMLQVAAFQTLALRLGSMLLETEQFRKAIMCLQRVWPSERLIAHQKKRLDALQDALGAVDAQPNSDPYRRYCLKQMIAKIQRELDHFRKIRSFDAALRLRLATAFQGLERYRESALILESMLDELPADQVVESASANLVQCWMHVQRWSKVVSAASSFAAKFQQSRQLPHVLYLKGIAQQRDGMFGDSIATFVGVSKKFPTSDFAGRAAFMKGFTELLAGRNAEAIATFEDFPSRYSRHELAEAAAYWRGMAYSLDKQFERCRQVMDEYLAKYPRGANCAAAVFRKAYAAQSLKNYETSIAELYDFLRKFPDSENRSEANLLLGDALMSQGDIDAGIAAYKRISPQDARLFEEGWFKIGKALRLREEGDKMREHFEQFRHEYPRSPRIAEAIYWIGWAHRQAGEDDKAREMYWDAINELGDEASARSVDDLFPALAKLCKDPEEQTRYLARLSQLRGQAAAQKRNTLAMRVIWAQARALTKSDPRRAQGLMLEAARLASVSSANPLLLADFARAFQAAGMKEDAERIWRDLLKWNPRAPQKADALAALGKIEKDRGNETAALAYFKRFEEETPTSALAGEVLLESCALQEKRATPDELRKALESLLANKSASGKHKAAALCRLGDLSMKEGEPARAIAYYQRVYVMYGRWSDAVVRAYLRSGEAFEKLNDPESARRTYEELVSREELSGYSELNEARSRIARLGRPNS